MLVDLFVQRISQEGKPRLLGVAPAPGSATQQFHQRRLAERYRLEATNHLAPNVGATALESSRGECIQNCSDQRTPESLYGHLLTSWKLVANLIDLRR
jgi:hypothetical protein